MKYITGLTLEEKIIRRRMKYREYSAKYRSIHSDRKKKSALAYYYRNAEKNSIYAKRRYSIKKEEILENNSKYIKSDRGKENKLRYYYEVLKLNPKKLKAQGLFGKRLARGKIIKKPCEICGSINVHGHHDDYNKPLEVRWLCPQHHANVHRKYGVL